MNSNFYEISAVIFYMMALVAVGTLSYRKQTSAEDFIIGDRSLNFYLTALAAHASDMSSWLFMGYPAAIFVGGLHNIWLGIGLIFFMWLNWRLVAPRIRTATEQYKSLTFSSFFESRLVDTSGLIRIFTSIMCIVFYTFYLSAGLVALGILMETLFDLPYAVGVVVGTLIVIPYVFVGGYTTLAWIDLFQGFFLLFMILFVPLYLLKGVGGLTGIASVAKIKDISFKLLPDMSGKTLLTTFFTLCSMGLGYFGQPHIVTKFMGIQNVSEIKKARRLGMSWMFLSLGAATLVGLVGIAFFKGNLSDPEQVFILMVKDSFHPALVGFILCAVLAATINAMSSQVLVMTSSLTEDIYKRIFRREAGTKELLFVSRFGVVIAACVGYGIALHKNPTVFDLVYFAWAGLGSAFGPLLLCCLYSNRINRYGAWAGVLAGGATVFAWKVFNSQFFPSIEIPAMIPGFVISSIAIFIVTLLTNRGNKAVKG